MGEEISGFAAVRDDIADVAIRVLETETYMIQELDLPVYHCLCLMLEERFFGEGRNRS